MKANFSVLTLSPPLKISHVPPDLMLLPHPVKNLGNGANPKVDLSD